MAGVVSRRSVLKAALSAPAIGSVFDSAIPRAAAVQAVNGLTPRAPSARLFVILDDASIGQRVALREAEERGQHLNLAVCTDFVVKGGGVDYLSWNDIRKAAQRGHGIVAHSKTHKWLTNASDAELALEFDSQATLANAAGVEVENFAYPSSKHDARTDLAAAGRFRHVFAGRWGGDEWRHNRWNDKPFVSGRYDWASSNHSAVIQQIMAATAAQEDIVIYTHATDGSNWHTEGVTAAEFTEVLELALQLGITVAHIDEFDSWCSRTGGCGVI